MTASGWRRLPAKGCGASSQICHSIMNVNTMATGRFISSAANILAIGVTTLTLCTGTFLGFRSGGYSDLAYVEWQEDNANPDYRRDRVVAHSSHHNIFIGHSSSQFNKLSKVRVSESSEKKNFGFETTRLTGTGPKFVLPPNCKCVLGFRFGNGLYVSDVSENRWSFICVPYVYVILLSAMCFFVLLWRTRRVFGLSLSGSRFEMIFATARTSRAG